jgi:hypothetical protein
VRANELERLVVERFLADHELKPVRSALHWDLIAVKERSLTGAGFLTEFEPSRELKVLGEGVDLRWGKVGARLNAQKVETGYLVYVDGGYITTVEGYTYGVPWPDRIDGIELYELGEGMSLENPPKSK